MLQFSSLARAKPKSTRHYHVRFRLLGLRNWYCTELSIVVLAAILFCTASSTATEPILLETDGTVAYSMHLP